MGFANREFRVAQTGPISDRKRGRKRLLPTQIGVSNATREMDKPRTLTLEFSIFVIFPLSLTSFTSYVEYIMVVSSVVTKSLTRGSNRIYCVHCSDALCSHAFFQRSLASFR